MCAVHAQRCMCCVGPATEFVAASQRVRVRVVKHPTIAIDIDGFASWVLVRGASRIDNV